jgi:hypothetical protein
MENASAAFLTAVQRSMVAIREAVGAGAVDPEALSAANATSILGGFAAKQRMLISWRSRLRALQSRRSCDEPTNPAGWCARWFEGDAMIYSEAG